MIIALIQLASCLPIKNLNKWIGRMAKKEVESIGWPPLPVFCRNQNLTSWFDSPKRPEF